MSKLTHLLLLGTGQVAKALIKQSRERPRIVASSRNPNRIFELADLQVEPLLMPLPSAEIVESLAVDADVLVSFPPDGSTDAIIAPACARARRIVYVSSTAVYGELSGRIDDSSQPDLNNERAKPRLQAESIWREHGAVVLRAPGIYSPESGLHRRLSEGSYKMPLDGSNYVSRIHVDDLALVINEVFKCNEMLDSTYLLGDRQPATLFEVVSWVCDQLELELPESVPLSEVNPTLRGSRQIDASRILDELQIELNYPGYKEGYLQCIRSFKAEQN